MLTVYSTQGSPGASTTAMHLAASWASADREVLLIELDPAGGSLSHNLGIQFTPGSASFVASGLPAFSNHLIDHAQDVLFENLHVMPAPASPTGARGIFNTFCEYAEDLRAISEREMAVIIDGGRITADTAASELTTRAAGVVVVCGNNSQLPSLEHLKGVLDTGGSGDGPVGCAVSVGKSPMDPDEWLETCGLTFCGSIEFVSDMATDLSAYMAKGKRKSKKWRASLEQVGEKLYPHAQPPLSGASHRRVAEEPTAAAGTAAAEGAGAAAPVPAPATSQEPAAYDHPPAAPPTEPPPMAPAPGEGYGQSHYLPPAAESQPGYGQSHHLPPAAESQPGYGQSHHLPPAAESQPGYGQSHYLPPAAESQPGYGQSHYLPPAAESQPGYGQSHYLPPGGGFGGYGQDPPPLPPEDYSGYGQPAPPPQYPAPHEQAYPPPQYPAPYEQVPAPYEQAYPPPQYPPPPHEQQQRHHTAPPHEQPQPPAAPHEQPQPPAAPHEQPQAPAVPHQPPAAYEQTPPHPGGQPDTARPAEAVEPGVPPTPNIQPTGSFRDWAIKLHGSNAEDMTADRRG